MAFANVGAIGSMPFSDFPITAYLVIFENFELKNWRLFFFDKLFSTDGDVCDSSSIGGAEVTSFENIIFNRKKKL